MSPKIITLLYSLHWKDISPSCFSTFAQMYINVSAGWQIMFVSFVRRLLKESCFHIFLPIGPTSRLCWTTTLFPMLRSKPMDIRSMELFWSVSMATKTLLYSRCNHLRGSWYVCFSYYWSRPGWQIEEGVKINKIQDYNLMVLIEYLLFVAF